MHSAELLEEAHALRITSPMTKHGGQVSEWQLTLNRGSLNNDAFWQGFHESAFVSLLTAGGGDCGMHAALGSCNAHGSIAVSNPRAWIRQVLLKCETAPACIAALELIVGTVPARELFDKVTSAIGQDLFLPGLSDMEASQESRCFVEAMRQHDQALASEGAQFMIEHGDSVERRSSCKTRILERCRGIFKASYKAKLIQPIAVRLGAIPGEFFKSSFFEDFRGRRLVAGTLTEFPDGGPETKFEALFDLRSCFDPLRWSLLVAGGSVSEVSAFRICLQDLMITLCDEDTPLVEVVQPLCEALLEFDSCEVTAKFDTNFVNRAWKCYRAALLSSDYWLTCDELLMLCTLAQVPIAIFDAHLHQLNLVASFTPEGAEPVLVKLDNDGRRAVRGHFERVVPLHTCLPRAPGASNPRIDSEETRSQVNFQNLKNALKKDFSTHLVSWLQGFFLSVCGEEVEIGSDDVLNFLDSLHSQAAVALWIQNRQSAETRR